MRLPDAKATLSPKVAAADYVYFQRDLYDLTGQTRSPDQTTGLFTRDVQGNLFETGKLYCFCASSLTIGDDLLIAYFNANGQAVRYTITDAPDALEMRPLVGGYPVALTNPQAGQVLGLSLVNGAYTLINQSVAVPTWDDTLAAFPNSNRPYTHGPGQQRSPALVDNIQRLAVSFFSGVEDIWVEATTPFSTLVRQLLPYLSLSVILNAGNTSRNGLVVGFFGLFRRVPIRSFTKIPVFVDAIIDGSEGYYIEEGTTADMVRNGFNTLDELSRVEVGQAIRDILFPGQQSTPIGLQAGRITGVRCITIPDGTVSSGDASRVKLTGVTDTATIAHTLGTTLFTQLIFDATGRPALNAWVDAIDAFHVRFNNPGISTPFTGELHLTKRLN